MTCCTYGCTGGHGCAAHTEPVIETGLHPVATHDADGVTVTEWLLPPRTFKPLTTNSSDSEASNHPWDWVYGFLLACIFAGLAIGIVLVIAQFI